MRTVCVLDEMREVFFLAVFVSLNTLAASEGPVPFIVSTSFAVAGAGLAAVAVRESRQTDEDSLKPSQILLIISGAFSLFAAVAGVDHFVNPNRLGATPAVVLAVGALLLGAAAAADSLYVFMQKDQEQLKNSLILSMATLATTIAELSAYIYILCEARRLSHIFVFPVFPQSQPVTPPRRTAWPEEVL